MWLCLGYESLALLVAADGKISQKNLDLGLLLKNGKTRSGGGPAFGPGHGQLGSSSLPQSPCLIAASAAKAESMLSHLAPVGIRVGTSEVK